MKDVSDNLRIAVNTEELESDAGRSYSNDDIKQYVEDRYGFKIHSAFIWQVREKLGIHQHENYRESCSDNLRVMVCSEEKEAAIIDALKYIDFSS